MDKSEERITDEVVKKILMVFGYQVLDSARSVAISSEYLAGVVRSVGAELILASLVQLVKESEAEIDALISSNLFAFKAVCDVCSLTTLRNGIASQCQLSAEAVAKILGQEAVQILSRRAKTSGRAACLFFNKGNDSDVFKARMQVYADQIFLLEVLTYNTNGLKA